jgi:hypothetical protein
MPTLLNKVHLFNHQVSGIRWLIHQEKGNIPSYFTETTTGNGLPRWRCEITSSVFKVRPKAMRGGILADDMVRNTRQFDCRHASHIFSHRPAFVPIVD